MSNSSDLGNIQCECRVWYKVVYDDRTFCERHLDITLNAARNLFRHMWPFVRYYFVQYRSTVTGYWVMWRWTHKHGWRPCSAIDTHNPGGRRYGWHPYTHKWIGRRYS